MASGQGSHWLIESPTILYHLCVARPYQISVNSIFKHVHTTKNMDVCPTELLKKTLHIHIPYLVAIVNNSFEQGIFPNKLRTEVVKPMLISDTINKDVLKKTTDQSATQRSSAKC